MERGWSVTTTAERFQVDAKTVRKWRDRFLSEGPDGLVELSAWGYYDLSHLIFEAASPDARWAYIHFSATTLEFPSPSDVAGEVEAYRNAVIDAAERAPIPEALQETFGSTRRSFFIRGTFSNG